MRFFFLNLEDVILMWIFFVLFLSLLQAESQKAVTVKNSDQAKSQTFTNDSGKYLSGRLRFQNL